LSVGEEQTAADSAELKLAQEQLDRGENREALRGFRRILTGLRRPMKSDLPAYAHFGYAQALFNLGRQDEAMAQFQLSFEAEVPFVEGGLRVGEILRSRGDIEGARLHYQAVLDFSPDLAEAHYGMAVIAEQLGDEGNALEHYRWAFAANPPHPTAGLRLAELALANGDPAAARDIYQTVLAAEPQLAEAHHGLGVCLLQLGHVADDAARPLRRALELNPEYPAAIVTNAFLSLFTEPPTPRASGERRALICVPILPFVRDWLGGQIYVLNFVRGLSRLPRCQRPRVILALLVADWQEIPTLRDTMMRLLDCEAVIGAFDGERRLLFSSRLLDCYVLRRRKSGDNWTARLFAQVDITFPVLYPCWGVGTFGRPLFWIPDLQHRFLPGNFSAAEVRARNNDMTMLSTRDNAIVFSSRDAERHFRQFLPRARCRTAVWHFCTLPDLEPAAASPEAFASLGLPKRYYYTPNQFWPHKDHPTLFRALRLILDRGREITFVCTGSDLATTADPYCRGLLDLIQELRLGDNLRLIGVLPRALQLEVMRRACAVIQPSLFEGWSTVVEDARMWGRPLILSDLPVHREQIDQEGVFFEPANPSSLADTVIRIDRSSLPGPDIVREDHASRELDRRAQESIEQFLRIVKSERKPPPGQMRGGAKSSATKAASFRKLFRKFFAR
jgi:glycosyltransferase involved in cell wall biosynthesis